jgi:hypothetical protein
MHSTLEHNWLQVAPLEPNADIETLFSIGASVTLLLR